MLDWIDRNIEKAALIFVALFLLIVGCVSWFAAAMEARSYQKYCDTPVTTWDALWLDLRIDECQSLDNAYK